MLIPVCCFSCGNVIGHLWEKYQELLNEKNYTVKEALDAIGVWKICCRTHVMTTVELIDDIIKDTGMIPEAVNDYKNGKLPIDVYEEIHRLEMEELMKKDKKENIFSMDLDL